MNLLNLVLFATVLAAAPTAYAVNGGPTPADTTKFKVSCVNRNGKAGVLALTLTERKHNDVNYDEILIGVNGGMETIRAVHPVMALEQREDLKNLRVDGSFLTSDWPAKEVHLFFQNSPGGIAKYSYQGESGEMDCFLE